MNAGVVAALAAEARALGPPARGGGEDRSLGKGGSSNRVTVLRDGKPLTVPVKLEQRK